ncbi:MAG: DUF4304 domain-containing protein [Gaiellaceae bacterium]
MDSVVALAQPLLKRAGFRKRRRTFNRDSEPGLVQVVNFQMGAFNPPGPGSEANLAAREELGLPGNLYGSFTINLGVYVGEMAFSDSEKCEGWISEYHCQLRQRLGQLLDPPADTWWSLDDPHAAHEAVDEALDTAGLPWLNRLASRDAILRTYATEGRFGIGLGPAGPVRIAWLLRATDPEAAEAVLRDYLTEEYRNPRHREWLEQTLTHAGLGHLLNS